MEPTRLWDDEARRAAQPRLDGRWPMADGRWPSQRVRHVDGEDNDDRASGQRPGVVLELAGLDGAQAGADLARSARAAVHDAVDDVDVEELKAAVPRALEEAAGEQVLVEVVEVVLVF